MKRNSCPSLPSVGLGKSYKREYESKVLMS